MNEPTAEAKPFLDAIKRIGAQARNWENITDFGSDLQILQPNARRRLLLSPKILAIAAFVMAAVIILQTALIYSELRAQRASIEKLQAVMQQATLKVHGKSQVK